MGSLERKSYDAGVRASNRAPNDKIVVIAVDDSSIANLGRWPWPRDIHAQMIDCLSVAHAKVIGYTVFFPEPQVDSAQPHSEQPTRVYGQLPATAQQQPPAFATVPEDADSKLATDRRLVGSVSAESNRTLGIALQRQLDVAFDRFIRCTLSARLMGNFYRLALDFERKRLFKKAEAVFQHLSSYNPTFRDLQQRLARARAMAATVVPNSRQPYDPQTDSVKVTDFRIARTTDLSKTKTDFVLGVPSYMSREQLAGIKIDGASDSSSLGATLYQLCCGSLPFTGESMPQLMFRIATVRPTDPESLNSTLPDSTVAAIPTSVAKAPAERFGNGKEMARALRAFMLKLVVVDVCSD